MINSNLKVYTAQYRYGGSDRLDITVRGDARFFAPTWETEFNHKKGILSDEEYTLLYKEKMQKSLITHPEEWKSLLEKDCITLVGSCNNETFCHRYLLAEILESLGAQRMGER